MQATINVTVADQVTGLHLNDAMMAALYNGMTPEDAAHALRSGLRLELFNVILALNSAWSFQQAIDYILQNTSDIE